MTTIELLQRYPPHHDSIRHGKASGETKAFNGEEPNPALPKPDPTQALDAKTKLLHDAFDRANDYLAKTQPEPASEYEGTFWKDPKRPRSRSPAYSEISDSFQSSDRIEHCMDEVLSTPLSSTSAQFRGPEGRPLGIEVAINEYFRGRLSTPILQEKELPNALTLRKRKQQRPHFGGGSNREWQETASCESVPFEQHGEGQYQQERSRVLFEEHEKRQDHLDSGSLKVQASRQQNYTSPQQGNDSGYQQERSELDNPKLQKQNDEDDESELDGVRIPLLSARRYDDDQSGIPLLSARRYGDDQSGIPLLSARRCGDDQSSVVKASSELHPALAHGNLPIGPLSTPEFQCEKPQGLYSHNSATPCLHRDSPQTALSHSPPRNEITHKNAYQAEPRINALAHPLHENICSSTPLDPCENTGVKSINREIGSQKTFEDSENDIFQPFKTVTSEDSEVDTDSDIVSWKTSGPLEDIPEESEDTFINTSPLNHGEPQHFTPSFAKALNPQTSSGMGETRDSVLALHGPQTELSALSSSPPCVTPKLKLMINPRKSPFAMTEPSMHHAIKAKSSEPVLSAATVAELKDPTRKKGCLSAATWADMKKTALSQRHSNTRPNAPKDKSQADLHPLLRSKPFSLSSFQPSEEVNDSPLQYYFEDDDSEGQEDEEEDNFNHQITMKPRLRPEAQDAETFVTQISVKEYPSSQFGKMREDAVPRYQCNDDDTEGHEAECAGAITSQRSTLRSSYDTKLVPTLENLPPSLHSTSPSATSRLSVWALGSADVMPSSTFQPSISSSSRGCYPNSAIGSPAAYNSWALTPHDHEHGNSFGTPSSATTLPTSTVPTPDTSFHSSSAVSRGMMMTPSSSFGQVVTHSPSSREIPMTPSSSFGNFTGNRTYRRSVSASSMFARYHRARYPDLPTAAITDSIVSSTKSAENDKARDTNDPFTSTCDTTIPFSLNLQTPSKENLADILTTGVDTFNTPTRRGSSRFSRHKRSFSSSRRPNTNEGIERTLSTMIFNPYRSRSRSRSHKRSHSTPASIDTTAMPDGSGPGTRRSLSVATTTTKQKWEIAPPPTPLGLRDDFSIRYRPEPLEADDHYFSRKDALQSMKQGLKRVFGRK